MSNALPRGKTLMSNIPSLVLNFVWFPVNFVKLPHHREHVLCQISNHSPPTGKEILSNLPGSPPPTGLNIDWCISKYLIVWESDVSFKNRKVNDNKYFRWSTGKKQFTLLWEAHGYSLKIIMYKRPVQPYVLDGTFLHFALWLTLSKNKMNICE